jgi:Family of unknown function (DUF5522)
MGGGGYLVRGTEHRKRSKREKAHSAVTMTDTVKPDREPATQKIEPGNDELRPDDFYYEGPYLVFTAAYHLRRGYCCNSDCRHCPYK